MIEPNAAYRALASRDLRFDGVFFVGVTSTGIYCRPICPAKTPMQKHCRFFASAEAAEKQSFRPCLRCRPELAPGHAPVDDARRIAQAIVHRIEEGLAGEGASLETIAAGFELSLRQLRRIVQKELGVSPMELIQTRRLLLAKRLLTETKLPITEIAFASGFASLRRFNDAFVTQYKMPPSRLRKQARDDDIINAAETSVLQLVYRPPYDWDAMLEFLSARAIKGVEWVTSDSYARTVRIGKYKGWIKVTHASDKRALMVEFAHSLISVLPALLSRLRNLFDLSARPDVIAAHLMKDKRLKPSLQKNPGLRVPGAFDGFEIAVRAILGQQITVKAATTIACRFVDAFGQTIKTPIAELTHLSPLPERVAKLAVEDIAKLGIIRKRANSIVALAKAVVSGELSLDAGANPETTMQKLIALPGIGEWTAHYIAMRVLRLPDAFVKGDIAVQNNLGVKAKEAEVFSQAWRPWRSYAVMHIWKNAIHRKNCRT